jgi:hypothetical protein
MVTPKITRATIPFDGFLLCSESHLCLVLLKVTRGIDHIESLG